MTYERLVEITKLFRVFVPQTTKGLKNIFYLCTS